MIGVLFFLLLMLGSGAAQAQIASPTLAPATIVTPMDVPNGGPPQIVGYSAANTPEAETVLGDVTFARTGTSQYTATVHSVGGITAGNVATLNVGVGLTASAGSMLDLITPVAINLGGTGTTTAPTAGQILIAQSATAFAPMPFAGDATITTNGQVAVLRVNGQTPGGTCAANQFVDVIDSSGRPTCTQPTITGVPNGGPPQFVGYSAANTGESETLGGGAGGCTYTRVAANTYRLDCPGFAPTNSPTFTGTVSMPSGGWTSTGITAPAGTFVGNVSAGGLAAPAIAVNSGTGSYSAAAGASYQQPGWTGTFPTNAVWDQNGLQNMQGLGIGTTVGADPIDIIRNQNAVTAVTVTNLNTGASAQAAFRVVNGANTMAVGITSTGAPTLPNSGFISSSQGVVYITGNNQPHQFYVGNNVMATIGTNGLQLPTPLGISNGGVGTGATPSQNQILVAQSGTAYAPVTMSGDVTITSTGATTVGTTGQWTPTDASGANLIFTLREGEWDRVGNRVCLNATIQYPSNSSSGSATVGGLPVPIPNIGYARSTGAVTTSAGGVPPFVATGIQGNSFIRFNVISGMQEITNAQLSGSVMVFVLCYPLS